MVDALCYCSQGEKNEKMIVGLVADDNLFDVSDIYNDNGSDSHFDSKHSVIKKDKTNFCTN